MKDAASSYAALDDYNVPRLHRAVEKATMKEATAASGLSTTSILRLLARQPCGPGTRAQAIAWLDATGAT